MGVSPKQFAVGILSMLAVVALVLAASDSALAQRTGPVRRIVVFNGSFADPAAQGALLSAHGGQPLRALRMVNGMSVMLPPRVQRALAARPEVLRIDVDAQVWALPKPDKPPKPNPPGGGKEPPPQPPQELPWGADRIDAEYAWPGGHLGAGVKVAVIDSGIDKDHPDLDDNIAGGRNFVSWPSSKPANPTKWDDDYWHGTHVAGIIAAENNGIGVVGVAPQASLYAVKVLDRTGSGYVSDVIAGIEWSIAEGMHIANMSLGLSVDIPAFHEACDKAAAAGLRLVAAAGNDGHLPPDDPLRPDSTVDYPAAYPCVIAVAATDASDSRPEWSSWGPEVYIAAPGAYVKSTLKDGTYGIGSGTSMAAPHVAGALALNLLADLSASADDLGAFGWDTLTGWGLVDAGEATTGIPNYGDDLP